MSSLILRTTASVLVHILVIFSLYLMVSGHNAPGGGFIAGLLTAVALALEYLAFGVATMRTLLRFSPIFFIPAGLGLSLATSLVPVFLGRPFLTQAFGHVELPLFGEVELASAVLFDLGIYLLVIGNVLTIIENLAERSDPSWNS